jgi:hypothetical protein
MHTLEPGGYYLMLRAGSEGTATARPAVVGIERPGLGPPPEVLRQYLEAAPATRSP